MLDTILFMAAEGDPSGISLDTFGNYGVLGVLTAILLIGARMLVSREMQRADRLEAEVTRLNTLIQEKHIPVLEAATAALKDSTDAFLKLQAEKNYDERRRGRDGGRGEDIS